MLAGGLLGGLVSRVEYWGRGEEEGAGSGRSGGRTIVEAVVREVAEGTGDVGDEVDFLEGGGRKLASPHAI